MNSNTIPQDLTSLAQRILNRSHVDDNGCRIWDGARQSVGGYGRIYIGGKIHYAHRIAYACFVGDPGNLNVCHSCDNPACVNPDHLWLGTQADNLRDRDQKGRSAKGEDAGSSKLKAEEVLMIRMLANTGLTQQQIAARFSIGRQAVGKIINGRRWIHI